jgi:hypothetical protein
MKPTTTAFFSGVGLVCGVLSIGVGLMIVCRPHDQMTVAVETKDGMATSIKIGLDVEDIYAELYPENISQEQISSVMMWALRSDPKCKWVELRGKPGDPKTLLVVRHTRPKS